MQDYDEEQIADASPSAFDAQKEDVKTAINVLEREAEAAETRHDRSVLKMAQKHLEEEVL